MDNCLVQKILDGDSEAFRHLIARHKDMAYSIAMSVTKNEFHAEEVLQVSFIKAYDKLSSFKGEAKFSTWLYKIVINESFKLVKKHKTELVDFVETLPEISNEFDNEILELEEADLKHLVNEALKRISSKESLVLRLFYLEENSINDICEITGWSTSNIKVILHRARINLKLILTETYQLDKTTLY